MTIRRVYPEFTDAARRARITGKVVLQAVVREDGALSVVGISQSLGYGLHENAQSALEQWRFCPATLQGQPTSTYMNVEANFYFQ